MNKIILGTAQFRMKYGFSSNNKFSYADIESILNLAKINNINLIDTANSYADTEEIIGKINQNKLDIISKFILDPNLEYNQIEDILIETLNRFKKKYIYGFLFHKSNQLFSELGKETYKKLEILKGKKIIKNIGISVYEVQETLSIIKNYNFDIVQAPVSIIDRRFIQNKLIEIFKEKNIQLHARSIFLKGLLLNKEHIELKEFSKFKFILTNWFDWLGKNNLNPISECIKFVNLNKNIDKFIIGIDSLDNLKEIIDVFNSGFSETKIPNYLVSDNEQLLNPNNWNSN